MQSELPGRQSIWGFLSVRPFVFAFGLWREQNSPRRRLQSPGRPQVLAVHETGVDRCCGRCRARSVPGPRQERRGRWGPQRSRAQGTRAPGLAAQFSWRVSVVSSRRSGRGKDVRGPAHLRARLAAFEARGDSQCEGRAPRTALYPRRPGNPLPQQTLRAAFSTTGDPGDKQRPGLDPGRQWTGGRKQDADSELGARSSGLPGNAPLTCNMAPEEGRWLA
ncbi:uncharacterized protein LOC110344473 isoform X2 [Heterocephalus glaber]|uniref:Uncharacterized protein LOC110344473 isoform X2 n=1 Tax=Heterocephalus glaber TaxID=10181 RepID=A0AAX6REY1_HETGA|nr:uncharacterized protein LOC110344473 isoform X2 [Heterocephalus glaber]